MNEKGKYLATIVGTVIGLVVAYLNTGTEFWTLLPVPLGIIGYSIGALLEDGKSK